MKMILCLVTSFFCLFFADNCNTNNLSHNTMGNETISELEKMTGLDLPEKSEIIFYDSEQADGGYRQWIVYSAQQKIDINQESDKADSQSSLDLFKDLMPKNYDFGKIKNADSESSSWANKTGRWQSQVVETSKGFYLYLELFG